MFWSKVKTMATLAAAALAPAVAVPVAGRAADVPEGANTSTPAPVNWYNGMQEREEVFEFTANPAVRKEGDKWLITFASKANCDATVTIVDKDGKVIRHLASGVLGKNAPHPFQQDSLSQKLEWDGKADWGKPAPAGPFRVRVALGLGARYDKAVIADPMSTGGVEAMAAAPDGTLYAVVGAGAGVANWSAQRLVALNRDGSFKRTLIPPPASATKEQIEALGGIPVQVGGRTVPMYLDLPQRRNTAFWSNDGAAVTPDGKFLNLHPDARIGLVDLTGAQAPPDFLGPKLLPNVTAASFHTLDHRQYLAVSGDGKYAYFSGIAPKRSFSSEKTPPYAAVYRVKLPERSPAEPFFGDPAKTGNDKTHLGGIAHGMAADGKGNLLICDPANRRVVVVSEADGQFTGSFPADSPELVAADSQSGAVYLLKLAKGGSADVVKLSGAKDPQQFAAIHLAAPREYLQWRLAVDAGAKPAVIWASNGWQLVRIEDLGDKFSDAGQIGGRDLGDGGFVNLTVDHYRDDPEIYVRSAQQRWMRFDERTEKIDVIQGMNLYTSAAGSCLEPGPDGNLYMQGWPQFLYKFDRNGKPLKWDVPFAPPAGVKPYAQPPNAIYTPVCMVFMTHTHGVRSDGHHFVFEARTTRGPKALYEYAPSGQRVGGPIIWKASDNVLGPRFDQAGNIYIAEQLRPADQPVPPEFAAVVGPVTPKSTWEGADPKRTIALMYGSILKFSPKGGMVDWSGGRSVKGNPFDGQPKLDPSLKTVAMGAIVDTSDSSNIYCTAKVTGAEWAHFGISHLPLFYCNCENTRFDVDLFGRVWYPDLGRYRVGVLDTNGNLIITFGSYGNAESCGPDIAFAWLIGVGATDKYAYMGDSLNRRLLRAKLVYAAEETCDIK